MDIIQRVYFVLKKLQPTPSATKNAICIIRRIARHSLTSAQRIVEHNGLLEQVFAKLNDPSSDALECTEALKTGRVISAWNRSLAQAVLLKLGDFSGIISRNIGLEFGNAAQVLESLRLWDTFLRYGLLTDLFTTIYPLIMKYYIALREQVSEATEDSNVRYDVAAMVIKLTEAYMTTNVVSVENMSNIMELIMIFIAAMLRDTFEKKEGVLELLDSCISFTNSFLLLEANLGDIEVRERRANEVFDKIVVTFFTSDLFELLIGRLQTCSAILSKLKDGRKRDPQNIPSIGVICENGSIVPTIDNGSPFRILRSIFNLVHSVVILNTNLTSDKRHRLDDILCCNDNILSYISAVCKECKDNLVSNWFSTDEQIMLLFYILIRKEVGLLHGDINESLAWQVASKLMCRLHTRHAIYIHVIFEKVISDLAKSQIPRLERSLGNVATSLDIDELQNLYTQCFPKLHGTWPFAFGKSEATMTLTQHGAGEQALPSDWTYLPLLMTCTDNDRISSWGMEKTEKIETRRVILSLLMVYISFMGGGYKIVPELDVALHFSRLMTLFIGSSSLFLESEVQAILRLILIELLKDGTVPEFLERRPIPGVEDMTDFYRQLVAQHAAVSYGDDLFSLFVLLPTGGRNCRLKDILWIEHQDVLGALKISPQHLSDVGIGIESFIDKSEDASVERIQAYAAALISGRVEAKRQPALFSIAEGNITSALRSGIQKLKATVDPMIDHLKLLGIH